MVIESVGNVYFWLIFLFFRCNPAKEVSGSL